MLNTLLLLLGFALSANAAKLPSFFQTCARNDPAFQECLRGAVEDGFKKLSSGYPNLGLTPLEPLIIPSLYIGKGRGPVNLNLSLKNMSISGITSLQITKQRTALDLLTAEYEAFNKKLVLKGDYEVDGKILLLPIRGKGKGQIELENVEGILTLSGVNRVRNNSTYFDLEKFDYKFNPSKMVLRFDNLFGGDRKLSGAMNRILNKHWKEVLREVKPAFEEALSEVFKNIARNLFTRVPVEEIYPIKK